MTIDELIRHIERVKRLERKLEEKRSKRPSKMSIDQLHALEAKLNEIDREIRLIKSMTI